MHYTPDGHKEHVHLLSLINSGALNLVLCIISDVCKLECLLVTHLRVEM